MSWSQFPFVRLILPFVLGIALAFGWEREVPGLVVSTGVVLLIYTGWVLVFSGKVSHRYHWVNGVLVFGILVMGGYALSWNIMNKSVPVAEPEGEGESLYILELLDDPVPTAKTFKAVARIVVLRDSFGWRPSGEKVMLYLEKDSLAGSLRYGDRLLVSCRLKVAGGPTNPGEFNFKRYLKFQGIHRTAFIKNSNWIGTGGNTGHPLLKKSRQLRQKLLSLLRENGITGKEYGLAAAILLGYDASLDDEQRRQFAGAGAMHVLCVSGLHVGIIAVVLSQALFFLNRIKWGRILKLFLLIGLIWFYAAVTGFSPSVLRASTMFTFIYTGRSFRRSVSIYNMLGASAFVLLFIEPRLLVQLGFQLSYLAVAGIVLLFKPIYGILPTLKGMADKIWQLTAVSMAATATTFPLSLFYFHQFPNLFWLTNLVAIPAAFLIVYLGLGVLVLSFLPLVSNLLGKVLSLVLYGLNRSVEWVESLPMSTTQNVYLAPVEFILLMGLVIMGITLVLVRKRIYFHVSLGLFILLLVVSGIRRTGNGSHAALIVYHIPGHSAYEFVWGNRSVFVCDSLLALDTIKISHAVRGYRIRQGIRETETWIKGTQRIKNSFLRSEDGLIFFGDRILLLPAREEDIPAAKILPRIDLAILSDGVRPGPDISLELPAVSRWVLDASIPPWNRDKWKDRLTEHGATAFDVNGLGAFVYIPE